MPWRIFSAIPGAPTGAALPVTAISRTSTHIDLFQVGGDGGVYSAYWDVASGWSSWFRIDNSFTKAATQIAVVARTPDHMDLFVRGTDRGVYSVVWDAATGWGRWFRIDASFANALSAVSVVARDPQHLDLFVAAPGGQVFSAFWNTAAGWSVWFQIDGGFSGAEGYYPVAVVSRSPTHLDLFVTGGLGDVFSTYWDAATGWAQWFKLDAGLLSARAPLTAVARDPNHIDLFTLAADNVVFTCAWSAASGWSNWIRVDNSFTARAGSTVRPLARTSDRLDLFASSKDGGVYTTTWNYADGGDRGWRKLDLLSKLTMYDVSVVALPAGAMNLFTTADNLTANAVQAIDFDSGPGLLRWATIQFDSLDDGKNNTTFLHVFVKNRRSDSSTPNPNPTFLSNLANTKYFAATATIDGRGPNPYLASGLYLGFPDGLDDNSSKTFDLPLTSGSVTANDVILPEVDIHILADGSDRWKFNYKVTLYFDDGPLTFISNVNGVVGIVLDQDNRNYAGIGVENPFRRTSEIDLPRPATNALLTKVTLEISTHNDNKNADTTFNVHCVNRRKDGTQKDILIALDLFHGQSFPDSGARGDTYRSISWTSEDNELSSKAIRLADMELPLFYIVMYQSDEDQWIFDYIVTFEFVDPADFDAKPVRYATSYNGVVIDQTINKHVGVYSGPPFPKFAPPSAPKLTTVATHAVSKHISIDSLQSKLKELVNDRNGGAGKSNESLFHVRLASSFDGHSIPGLPSPTPLPESYSDVESLINGGDGNARYVSNPSSLGQLNKYAGFVKLFFEDIESASLNINAVVDSPTPVSLTVTFQPNGKIWSNQWSEIQVDSFSVEIMLTLNPLVRTDDNNRHFNLVDVMSWTTDIDGIVATFIGSVGGLSEYRFTGSFLGQPIDVTALETKDKFQASLKEKVIIVHFNTDSTFDPGGFIRQAIRDQIYSTLTTPNVFTNLTPRDGFNSLVTSWLAGGVADDSDNTDQNNVFIKNISIQNRDIVVDFIPPQNVFVPTRPADWPGPGAVSAAHDFSPSTLANIDHIVVLTKENRSFDHMLGYLSLPTAKGGMGRADIDGLKGGETNSYEGEAYASFALSGTRFAPGPSNAHEAMQIAIDDGAMDGFVRSHVLENGLAYAGQVMGYHTGAHVPVYDAIARDFAIGDRWFCSHPGPTFPNRFYELTGRLNLDTHGFWEFDNSSPIRPVFTNTIFDYFNGALDPISNAPVTWRHFEHGYCTLRFFAQHTFDHDNIVGYDDPEFGFVASARAGNLPSVSFIDPHFVDFPPGSNCDEPPSDIADGQAFVREVVEAVVAGPKWDKTLLLIVYDECGGFYDHVPPPIAPRVSDDLSIQTVGLRVPALLVSPFVGAGTVFGNGPSGKIFDHTSILKTIARRFLSKNPPYLGARYAAAGDLSSVLSATPQKSQFLPFIRYRLQFITSQLMLDVQGANPAPGAILWQYAPNGTAAQDYSFEEVGDGSVYIRSHVSNLYVTARSPLVQRNPGSPTPAPTVATIIHDVKYGPGREVVVDTWTPRPQQQRWILTGIGFSVLGNDSYLISNQAYPDLVLQPTDPNAAQSLMTLSPQQVGGLLNQHQGWKITSPVINTQIVAKP